MKFKIVLEAQIEDGPHKIVPEKIMRELRTLIGENEVLADLKITGGQLQWEKQELVTS